MTFFNDIGKISLWLLRVKSKPYSKPCGKLEVTSFKIKTILKWVTFLTLEFQCILAPMEA